MTIFNLAGVTKGYFCFRAQTVKLERNLRFAFQNGVSKVTREFNSGVRYINNVTERHRY